MVDFFGWAVVRDGLDWFKWKICELGLDLEIVRRLFKESRRPRSMLENKDGRELLLF